MSREEENLAKWLKKSLPSVEETEMTRSRVFDRLVSLEAEESQPASSYRHAGDLGGKCRRVYLAVGTAAAIVAVLFGIIGYRHRAVTSVAPLARMENPGNSRDPAPQLVRTDTERGTVIPLADGSQVEVRSLSELRIEHAQDGILIQLARGSVIVTAAKQRAGHLYVRTRDTTVTVTGTIFFVGVEEDKGSRVGVIEGEVRVQQGGNWKILEPGELFSTNPAMPTVSITEEIAWSQYAPLHLALLGQSAISQSPSTKPAAAVPQAASAEAQRPSEMEFDTASVKRSQPGNLRGSTFEFLPGGGLRIVNGTLRAILETAYDIREYQILGGPGWVNSDRYDILARSVTSPASDTGQPPNSVPLVRLRLQKLLVQRFKLEVHGEARELPEYALEVAKNGPKLVSDANNSSPSAGIRRSCGEMVGTNTTMTNLSVYLARQLDRPVVDRTSLTGKYSFQLQWTPDTGPCPGASDDRPSIFTALQEQLGLKLESIKGPVDSLIIDHAEQPTEN